VGASPTEFSKSKFTNRWRIMA